MYIERINKILESHNSKIDIIFNECFYGFKQNLNKSITRNEAIELISQHIIIKPIFDAIFSNYEFLNNNPISQNMQKITDILNTQLLNVDEEIILNNFYKIIQEKTSKIDNIESKQKVILELFEKFFKITLPKEVEKLGIVYTPIECVDFIIHSVETILREEFGKSLADKGIHIIDGFTGTGTFIVRLLQSGIIDKDKLLYKYTNDIHANEIVLLAYYIATINIEEVFHENMRREDYVHFNGISLADTFQFYEDVKSQDKKLNSVTVCIGNPPYSIGQKSANDDAQNLHYEKLDKSITDTYAKYSKANLKRGLYDNYIRAFRWASNVICDSGIIGFITNGAYINNQGMDGFRKCLIDEFNSVYVFNLRGNARTSGEQRRKEKDSVFGQGTRTTIAITFLVKNPNKENDGYIHYCDIGDYLSREDKLKIINNNNNINNIEWEKIYPDENNDWINKRNSNFDNFISVFPEEKGDLKCKSFFTNYAVNPLSSRDSWVYNFNKDTLCNTIQLSLNTYNETIVSNKKIFTEDATKISWSAGLKQKANKNIPINFDEKSFLISQYRPYCRQNVYYNNFLFERPGKLNTFLNEENLYLCVSGVGGTKSFSCLMTNMIPDFQTLFNAQCFPLYWYEETSEKVIRHDGISDYILNQCRSKYKIMDISKEDIFYYVYGILHSKNYREAFESDLKKSLPKMPLTDTYDDFKKFSIAGKQLSELHVNYDNVTPYSKVSLIAYKEDYSVAKMKFNKDGKKIDKSCIIFNDYITIGNIPEEAYDYIVNGKSAIEWVMERYAVTIDKKSGIKNDPNDWINNVGDARYILNLLLKVVNVSVQTVNIVNSLPKLNFD